MSKEASDLLGAISAAFPEPAAEPAADEPAPEGEAPAGDDPQGDETPPEGETPATEEAADESEGDEAEGDEAEEGDEEGEEEGELDENGQPKKAFDPMKDPLPKGTLQRTRESFERLRGIVKESNEKLAHAETQLQTVTKNYEGLIGAISGSGLNDQSFETMLSYAADFNSPKFEDRERAFEFLMSEAKQLAASIGRVVPGEHPLKGHDDLLKEVQEKRMTPQYAVEMANQRNRQAAIAKHTERFGAQQQQREQQSQAVAAARAELSTLGKELSGKDGATEYQRKAKIVLENMQDEIQALPPNRWAAAFRKAYALIPSQVAKAPVKAKPAQQPMRGKAPAGGGSKKPQSMLEAISQGLDRPS